MLSGAAKLGKRNPKRPESVATGSNDLKMPTIIKKPNNLRGVSGNSSMFGM